MDLNPSAKPAIGIWNIASMVLRSLTPKLEHKGSKPPVYVDTPRVLDGGNASLRASSDVTEPQTVYVQVNDPEVVTVDERAVAATVRMINCHGQVVLEKTGTSLGDVVVLEEEREVGRQSARHLEQ